MSKNGMPYYYNGTKSLPSIWAKQAVVAENVVTREVFEIDCQRFHVLPFAARAKTFSKAERMRKQKEFSTFIDIE